MTPSERGDLAAPLLAVLDALGDLAELVRRSREPDEMARSLRSPIEGVPAGGPRRGDDEGGGVSSGAFGPAIRSASARFRDQLMASLRVNRSGPRKLHHTRGARVGAIIDRNAAPTKTYGCHSDEAVDVAVEHYFKFCNMASCWDDELEGLLDEDEVVAHWAEVVEEWRPHGLIREAIDRLKAAIAEEHKEAPEIPVYFPVVHSEPSDAPRAAREAEARRVGFTVGLPPGPDDSDPVDELFWVSGEPSERSITKVSGLPYRPPGLPWPRTCDGKPFVFLAQFSFGDSRDLFDRALPGDMLLVFVTDREFYLGHPFGEPRILYEWHSLGLGSLMDGSEIPEPSWKLRPFSGVRHRTSEGSLAGEYPGLSKIGGEPSWIQGRSDPGESLFLGSLGPLHEIPEAWASEVGGTRAAPDDGGEDLSMQDAGSIYFFLDDDGGISEIFQCY